VTTTGGPTPLSRSALVLRFVRSRQGFVRRCHGMEKARPLKAGAKLAERLEVEFGPFRSASSRGAELLLAYICRSITHRVHFLDKGRSHLWGLVHLRQRFVRWSHGKPAYMGPKAGRRLSQEEAKRFS